VLKRNASETDRATSLEKQAKVQISGGFIAVGSSFCFVPIPEFGTDEFTFRMGKHASGGESSRCGLHAIVAPQFGESAPVKPVFT
jgi:hypothetical protein